MNSELKKISLVPGTSLEYLSRDEEVHFLGQDMRVGFVDSEEAQLIYQGEDEFKILFAYLENYKVHEVKGQGIKKGHPDYNCLVEYFGGFGE